jgi:hypothetical protein
MSFPILNYEGICVLTNGIEPFFLEYQSRVITSILRERFCLCTRPATIREPTD